MYVSAANSQTSLTARFIYLFISQVHYFVFLLPFGLFSSPFQSSKLRAVYFLRLLLIYGDDDRVVVCSVGGVVCLYRGADKTLARPGRKQATATEDFEFHISYL